MHTNDPSITSVADATLNLCREFAHTALLLVRMPEPDIPLVPARVSAIVMMLTTARLICKAQPRPDDPFHDAVFQVYESTLQKLSEKLIRDLCPEMAATIDARMRASLSRESTINSLRALAEGAAKDGKIIPEIVEPDEDDGLRQDEPDEDEGEGDE